MKSSLTLGLTAVLLLSACSTTPPPEPPRPKPTGIKIGQPYQVMGKWYYPKAEPDYDESGVASWYGPGFHGKYTAYGEVYDQEGLTAAHTTLPMPSDILVTNLDNGRQLRLRVNDRGPFVDGRILDVTRRAAQLLEFKGMGTANVRVQLIRPDGTYAVKRDPNVPEILVSTAGDPGAGAVNRDILPDLGGGTTSATPTPPPAVITNFIQIGSFASEKKAQELAGQLYAVGNVVIEAVTSGAARLWRVRLGPYETREAADSALEGVIARGFADARVVSGR